MQVAIAHPRRALIIVGGTLGLAGGLSALVASSGHQSGRALLSQLERPAVAPASVVPAGAVREAGPGPVRVVATAAATRLAATITPNRAGAVNAVALTVTDHGRPVSGARVTVTYSMPAMHMADAFTLTLAPRSAGVYTASEPIVGMPGVWRMRVSVSRAGVQPATVTLDDRVAL